MNWENLNFFHSKFVWCSLLLHAIIIFKNNGINCKTENYNVRVKRWLSKIRQMLDISMYYTCIYILHVVYIIFIPRDQPDVEEDLERKGSLAHPDTRDPWYVNHFIFVKSMYEKHSKKNVEIQYLRFFFYIFILFCLFGFCYFHMFLFLGITWT